MILKMVMKTQIYLWAASLCLLLTLCGSGVKKKGDLEVIPLEAALEKQKGLKVSDCFKKVRYVPLETTNNCLVGRGALAQILGDYIVVISEMNLCHLFDKQTGRFIRSVGRVGQGPGECQSLRGGWQNPHNKLFYFPGWKKDWHVYQADGRLNHTWRPSIRPGEFPTFAAHDYLDAEVNVSYYSETDKQPARLIAFKGDEPIYEQVLPLGMGNKEVEADEIALLSVRKGGACNVMVLKRKNGKCSLMPYGNINFWHGGKELYFKQPYNDTIYRVSPKMELQPVRLLDLGAYEWPFDERFEEKKDAIYPASFLESKDIILFRFITNVYDEEKHLTYNALYRKADGIVKVSPFKEKIIDDRNGFLPLQPLFVSPEGEYADILPADEVVAWFEEHTGKTGIPAEVAALKKVSEEDNPVVVIME